MGYLKANDIISGQEGSAFMTINGSKDYSPKYVTTVTKVVSTAKEVTTQPVSTAEITIGCTVIVNGRLHRDSYGTGPGQTEVNATRKVNFIQKGRSHPYHVTLVDGGWRGWVTAESVRRI